MIFAAGGSMKWFCSIAFFFFLAAQPLFAVFDEVTQLKEKEQREITSMEEKMKRLEGELGIKTPPQKTTYTLFGNFIYCKASLDGVAYATTAVGVVNADGSAGLNRFKTRSVHFAYDPGFSVGIGMGVPYDNWDISLRWLRFYTTGKDKAHATGHRMILDEIGMLESLLSPPSKATADCRIHLNVVDLILGKTFFWSHFFEFRPYAGLRGGWVDIDWEIAFTMPITIPSPVDQSFAFLDVDNDFNGIGFLGGFESKWTFYKGFGLFSYAMASLIYGKSSERTKEKFFLVPAFETTTLEQTLKAGNATHTVKSIFDIALGLKWEIHFKPRYRFLVRAGYEFFYWPNVTQKTVIQTTRLRDRADLSFQGLFIGARFDF
jgi:hypothetical protein